MARLEKLGNQSWYDLTLSCQFDLIKFIYSHLRRPQNLAKFDWHYIGQIYGGDFAKFWGLWVYELYNCIQSCQDTRNKKHPDGKLNLFPRTVWVKARRQTRLGIFLIVSPRTILRTKKLAIRFIKKFGWFRYIFDFKLSMWYDFSKNILYNLSKTLNNQNFFILCSKSRYPCKFFTFSL